MTKRPVPQPTFDPDATKAIAERYKDKAPIPEKKPIPTDCTCQWHAIDPECITRISTREDCPHHGSNAPEPEPDPIDNAPPPLDKVPPKNIDDDPDTKVSGGWGSL